MSKLIAIIDDNHWIGCPLEHEGCCHIAWNEYYQEMEECEGVLNQRPQFCPLKEHKEAISIEWIERYAKKGGRIANILFPFEIEMMLEDWEKENETN